MNLRRHGLFVGFERVDESLVLSFKAKGKLTHEDYEQTTPMIESALSTIKDTKLKVFLDGTEFDGWEAKAAWDDFKLGLKHGSRFEKIAIHGNKNWQQVLSKVGGWFISGEVKYFEKESEAVDWLIDQSAGSEK